MMNDISNLKKIQTQLVFNESSKSSRTFWLSTLYKILLFIQIKFHIQSLFITDKKKLFIYFCKPKALDLAVKNYRIMIKKPSIL